MFKRWEEWESDSDFSLGSESPSYTGSNDSINIDSSDTDSVLSLAERIVEYDTSSDAMTEDLDSLLEDFSDESESDPAKTLLWGMEKITQMMVEDAYHENTKAGQSSQPCANDSFVGVSEEVNPENLTSDSVIRNPGTGNFLHGEEVQIKREETSHDHTEPKKHAQLCTSNIFVHASDEDNPETSTSDLVIRNQNAEDLNGPEAQIESEDTSCENTELENHPQLCTSYNFLDVSEEDISEKSTSDSVIRNQNAENFMDDQETQIKGEDECHDSFKEQNSTSSEVYFKLNDLLSSIPDSSSEKRIEEHFAKDELDADEAAGKDCNEPMCTDELSDNAQELQNSAEQSSELPARNTNLTREGEFPETDSSPSVYTQEHGDQDNKQTEASNEHDETANTVSNNDGSPIKAVMHSNAGRRAYLLRLRKKVDYLSTVYNDFKRVIPHTEESSKDQVGNKSLADLISSTCKPLSVRVQRVPEGDLKDAGLREKEVKNDSSQDLAVLRANSVCSDETESDVVSGLSSRLETNSEVSSEESLLSPSSGRDIQTGLISHCPHCKADLSRPKTENNNAVPGPLISCRRDVLLELFSTDNVLSRNILFALMSPDFQEGATVTELFNYLRQKSAELKKDVKAFLGNALRANLLTLKRRRYHLAEVGNEIGGKSVRGQRNNKKSPGRSATQIYASVLLNKRQSILNRKRKLEVRTDPDQVFKQLPTGKVLKSK